MHAVAEPAPQPADVPRTRLRALLEHPRVEPVVAVGLRARLVCPSSRFAARELRGDRRCRTYRLRGSGGVAVALQHGTPDVHVLDEIFHQRLYEPPAAVRALLEARGAALRALDLGGNVGMFGAWLAARFGFAALESFEPDPRNASLLRQAIAANRRQASWRLHEAAAGTAAGTARFASGAFATSHVVQPGEDGAEAVDVPVVDVVALLPGTDLLKMDIEGGEWPILADPRFARDSPPVVVLEWHPEGCPAPDPHAEVRRLLEGAGHEMSPIFEHPTGVGMAWAWRADATTPAR